LERRRAQIIGDSVSNLLQEDPTGEYSLTLMFQPRIHIQKDNSQDVALAFDIVGREYGNILTVF